MRVVVGIDSGGTNTRSLAVTLDGSVVGYGESGGGHPHHASAYRENIREALARSLDGVRFDQVARIIAGIAGNDGPKYAEYFQDCTDLPGLSAERLLLNDAEIAHYGALEGRPGIITVQGTGSNVLALLENGRKVNNSAFMHYAHGASVWVGMLGAFAALSATKPDDLVAEVLNFWNVKNPAELHELASRGWGLSREEAQRRFGEMATRVTAAAEAGSPLAKGVCEWSANEIAQGIVLLGSLFESNEVLVALIGSCVRSPFMERTVRQLLENRPEKRYRIVEPEFPPVVGAVLIALEQEGVRLDAESKKGLVRSYEKL